MAKFDRAYLQELKKEAAVIKKTLIEFETRWGMTSEEMCDKLRNQPDYRKKLTVGETVWMVEYGRYQTLMKIMAKRM